MLGKSLKSIFVLSLIVCKTQAQIAVGLRESSLGNSGVAITDSSAPSHYNPALLSERQKSYFSITGTTLTSFQSSTEAGDFNSTKFAPNYLSSINAFETYVHEFSLTNQLSVDARIASPITNGTQTTNIKSDQYNLAYSFAFRNFPFGFQLGIRMNEENIHLNQVTDDGTTARGVNWDISQRVGHLFAGFGGIHQLGSNYRFGYKYETRGVSFFKKTDQIGTYYLYDRTGNTFTTGSTKGSSENNNFNTQVLTIGHSFAWGAHEMLTDSRFTEDPTNKDTFDYFQTFGYKINFDNKMQFMCGFSHEFETQANYYSSGFSWLTNTLRSTVSAYYAHDKDVMESTGLTFGSEFIY